ncbi:MAG: tRNA (adenosine(37)-N6)-threonylcarbamoyltransferase complex transferase subunit TsaD [Candidatus Omnitrophica bacterium]|nr:tRNA (adenosine(37)-N6)-threonylcarbamoyltransferase complex transferase subunit TsaD [Candidatus Omnitrophota bacterium]
MNILGIETSCDETSLSLIKDGEKILNQQTSSSLRYHRKYGGVVPEIASRMHLEVIGFLFEVLWKQSGLTPKDINLVAVTTGPGLLGSLLVGVCFAKAISYALDVSLVGVNHLHGHLYAVFLGEERKKIKFPFIGLVVSGGHTCLFYVRDFLEPYLLGSTLDDACGEVLDKVARVLNLGYPGGPIIERLARKGNPKGIHFNPIKTKNPLDFSFSGVKTAVLYYLKQRGYKIDSLSKSIKVPLGLIRDICASFQEVVFDSLIEKSLLACKLKKVDTVVVGGGVAINNRLREKFFISAKKEKIKVYFSPPQLCLDNASMIAGLGYILFKFGKRDSFTLKIHTD